MTIGKFTWGTIKLVVNFVVVLVFGMTTYFIYSTITTLPLDVVALDITPEGTNFGVDPTLFALDGGDGIGKLLKGDYFVTDESGDLTIAKKNAVTNGLSYYPFDYSSEYPAKDVYKNTNMNNINLWLGKGSIANFYGYEFDDYEYIENKAFSNRETWGGDRYTAADFPGDPTNLAIGKTWREAKAAGLAGPKSALVDQLKENGGHPKISADGQSLVAPTFSFSSYGDMEDKLTDYFVTDSSTANAKDGQKIVDAILSYWLLRIGSQVDSYVQIRAQRLAGGGEGSGGLGAIQLSGDLVAVAFNIDYYGIEVDKSATIVVGASAKVGMQALGPLLTTVDFTIAGWGDDGKYFRYFASAADEREKLYSGAYTGPDGVWKAANDNSGTLPSTEYLQSKYDDYVPEKTEFTANDENKITGLSVYDEATGFYSSEIKLCEFGMPASTYSDHIVDLRTIKSAKVTGTPGSNDFKAYTTDIVCYTRSDGVEWGWVSENSARSLANGIGGYASEGPGPVGYLYYTTLTITLGVFESGFMRSWKTDEFWDASIAGLIEAKVKVGTNSVFTYDVNDIMSDKLNMEMSLPGQIRKMQTAG
jgi:hypothetical protein